MRPQSAQPRSNLPIVTGTSLTKQLNRQDTLSGLNLAHFPRFYYARRLKMRRNIGKKYALEGKKEGNLIVRGLKREENKYETGGKVAFLTGISLNEAPNLSTASLSLHRTTSLASMLSTKGSRPASSSQKGTRLDQSLWNCTWSNEVISRSCQVFDSQSGTSNTKRAFLRLNLGAK